ncbi:MAG: secondary thiamine-phosphate synthase enzyme YjbQ [Candidatus Altiarchaeota archaeon]
MTVITKELRINTKGDGGMTDITGGVQMLVTESKLKNGIAVVFCPGSTGALSTVEYEPGLLKDVPAALERMVPKGQHYNHHGTWGDDNGPGHVKATILGPDLTIPFTNGRLTLGQWQQITFIECDTKDRERKLVVQIIGE